MTNPKNRDSSGVVRGINPAITRYFSSGANRDRTGDLLLAKQALSQLSYGPRAIESNAGVRES
jgi:hypothetical protein